MIVIIFSCKKDKPTPILTTTAVTAITKTTGTSGGDITNDGGETIISRGVCWSTNNTPTIADNKTLDGAGAGSFVSAITGLTPGTTYFVRAYATNASANGYGMVMSFITQPAIIPTLTTANVTAITRNTATCGGTITSDGAASIIARGVCWSSIQNPTTSDSKTSDGSGTGNFTSSITGLTRGTTYYIRAFATNSAGTAYGIQLSFTTLAELPTISTSSITNITTTTANSGGNISSDGGALVTFRGVCWSASVNPTISNSRITNGSGIGIFVSSLTGLSPATTYYVRSYATNIVGTAYGTEVSFTTDPLSVSDIDGNTYNVVRIGTQLWMAENIKTTKYNDGTAIPLVSDNTAWLALTTPGYCWYNNDVANKATYGSLYNWYTINTSRLCPTGWHVPTDAQWTTLLDYLTNNGYGYGGSGNHIAKSMAATSGWTTSGTAGYVGNDQSSNNSSGFTAIPSGIRDYVGSYSYVGGFSGWWSATQGSATNAWYRHLSYVASDVYSLNVDKRCGFSVRCVRDY